MKHYFDIGDRQFSCEYDTDYKKMPLWYTTNVNDNFVFKIDTERGFRTPEACEKYIKQRVKIACKQMLKHL